MTREALSYIQRNYLRETVIKHPDRAEATRIWNFPYADALSIFGPVAPAKAALQWRFVAGNGELPLLLLVVEDFQEQQPDDLADTLGVAIYADVLAHDVLDSFDQGADGHKWIP